MNVRDATRDDAEAIATVHVRTWQGAYGHVFPTDALAALSPERRAAFWREDIDARAARTHRLVVEDEAGVCGFASIGPARDEDADSEHEGELYAIYVLPTAWGNGAGRALMAELVARLRGDGFREALLWVLEDNPRARRFYERAGWRLDGGRLEGTHLGTEVTEVRYRIVL